MLLILSHLWAWTVCVCVCVCVRVSEHFYMQVNIWVSNISSVAFQELGISITHSNTEVVCGSDVVFVAVKPHLVPPVLNEISQHVTDRHIIVSVAAGVTLSTLEEVSAPAHSIGF